MSLELIKIGIMLGGGGCVFANILLLFEVNDIGQLKLLRSLSELMNIY